MLVHNEKKIEKNIFQRGEVSFQVKMMVNGSKISGTFDDLSSAREFRDRKRVETSYDDSKKKVYESKVEKSQAKTFLMRHAFERYRSEVSIHKKGVRQERYIINTLTQCKLAGVGLYHVNEGHIEYLLKELQENRPLSGSTIRKYTSLLSHLFSVAQKKWKMRVESPMQYVALPKTNKGRTRRYEPGEEKRLLRACHEYGNPWLVPAIIFSVEAAPRQGEIFKWEWQNVRLNKKTTLFLDTKNGEHREIPLSPRAIRVIQELAVLGIANDPLDSLKHKHQTKEIIQLIGRDITGLKWRDIVVGDNERLIEIAMSRTSGKVFKVSQTTVAQAYRRSLERARLRYEQVCARAKIEPDPKFLIGLRLHDLRHEATSRLFETGLFGDREVMSVTGHKTVAMLSRYAHLRAETLAEKLAQHAEKKNK